MVSAVAQCMPRSFRPFRRSGEPLSPHDLCSNLLLGVQSLSPTSSAASSNKSHGPSSKGVHELLVLILSTIEKSGVDGACKTDPELAVDLIASFLDANLPSELMLHLDELDFETRKQVERVFGCILRRGPLLGAERQVVQHLRDNSCLLQMLLDGCKTPSSAVFCSNMLRSCAGRQQLAEVLFASPFFMTSLFQLVQHEQFEVSSDAFCVLHDLLLSHTRAACTYIEANFQLFFKALHDMLQSEHYINQRQTFNLLNELLVSPAFVRIMKLYVGSDAFLRLHMNLLLHESKVINFEAFQTMRLFVANPQKPPRVQQILTRNRKGLLRHIGGIQPINGVDPQRFLHDQTKLLNSLRSIAA